MPEKDTEANGGRLFAKIKCQVKKEGLRVNWLRDENIVCREEEEEQQQESNKNHKFKMIQNGKEHILIVNDLKTDDEGEYVCQSQSGRYRVTLFLMLNDSDKSDEKQNEGGGHEIYIYNDHESKSTAHRFSTTKEIYIQEGVKHVELKCRVNDKNAQVKWSRNDQNCDVNNKYQTINRKHERILLINNPTRSDNGDYVCSLGKHKVILTLHVSPNIGVHTEHEIVENPDANRDLTFYKTENANLKYILKEKNERIAWYKDNVLLCDSSTNLNENKYETTRNDQSVTFQIKNLQDKDGGKYFCQSKSNPNHKVEYQVDIKGIFYYFFE